MLSNKGALGGQRLCEMGPCDQIVLLGLCSIGPKVRHRTGAKVKESLLSRTTNGSCSIRREAEKRMQQAGSTTGVFTTEARNTGNGGR